MAFFVGWLLAPGAACAAGADRRHHAAPRIPVLSALHASIEDAFNEHGVQIMSPHFLGQPEHSVVVPKAKWYAAPASPVSQVARG